MGRLLVAGDSFGEFSGYRNHVTTTGYAEPAQGYNYQAKFTHWCEKLATTLNLEPHTHALGGAGISASSFIALQQLQTKQYDMLIFFVSHHARSMVNRVHNRAKWKQHIAPTVISDQRELHKLYDTENKVFENFQTHYDPNSDIPETRNVNAEDVYIAPESLNKHEMSYITNKPGYSFIHDSIGNVLAVKQYCEYNGIPVVFASCFSGGVCDAINNLGIPLKHFKFWECEYKHNFNVRDDYPSHYNHTEHELIYKEFITQYPEIYNLHNKNH